MTRTPGDGGSTGAYSSQVDTLRSAARWLIAAFAGVGALLVASLPISGIGQLSPGSWRLYAAGGSAAVALAAVAFMITQASAVLTHEWLTLASLGDEQTDIIMAKMKPAWRSGVLRELDQRLQVSRHELFGYAAENWPQLHTRLRETDELLWRARPESRRAMRLGREAAVLRNAARDAAQYANYYYTLKLFERMRIRVAVAGLVTAVCVGLFAYAANPPKHAPPLKAAAGFYVDARS
jgi:hypothetical protein